MKRDGVYIVGAIVIALAAIAFAIEGVFALQRGVVVPAVISLVLCVLALGVEALLLTLLGRRARARKTH